MRFDVVTLFGKELEACCGFGVLGRAIRQKLVDLHCWDPRSFAPDERGTIDDRPFGGGPGMVMQYAPVAQAIEAAKQAGPATKVCYLSPHGSRFCSDKARYWAGQQRLILLCGRYEGVDQRLIDRHVDEQWSIGDFVVSGGELPAAMVIDAITRFVPGALGKSASAEEDSFVDGLLDCPHYTRPEEVDGLSVPEVLLSGDHQAIARWRRQQALGQTWLQRPDLLGTARLDEQDKLLLREFIEEHTARRRRVDN